jgi:hypothetical protein
MNKARVNSVHIEAVGAKHLITVIDIAVKSKGADKNGYRDEFV